MKKLKKLAKKAWKGIKRAGKKIGRGFKKAFGKVSKAFGKLGPLGSIAMMIIMPGLGSSIWKGLGNIIGTVGGTATQAGTIAASEAAVAMGTEAATTAAGKAAITTAQTAATETAKKAAMDSASQLALDKGLSSEAARIAAGRAGEQSLVQASGMLASSNSFVKGMVQIMKFTYDGIGQVGSITGNVTDSITDTFTNIGGGHMSNAFNNIRQWMGMEPTSIDIASNSELLTHADSIENLKQIEGLGDRAYQNVLKLDPKNIENAKIAKLRFYNAVGIDEKVFNNIDWKNITEGQAKDLYNKIYTTNSKLMVDGKLTEMGAQLTANNKMLYDMHAQGRAIYSETNKTINYNKEFLPNFEKKYASTYKPIKYEIPSILGRTDAQTYSFEEFGNDLLTSPNSNFNPTTKFGKGIGTKYDTFMDTDALIVDGKTYRLGNLKYGPDAPHQTWAGMNPYGAAAAKTTEAIALDSAQTALFGEMPEISPTAGTVSKAPSQEEGIAYTLAEQEYKQASQAQMESLGYDVNLMDMQQLLGAQDSLWGGGTFNYQAELARI